MEKDMDYLQKQLEAFSTNVDNFPVGAANVHNNVSLESEVSKVQSNIHCTNADILFQQALIELAKTSNVGRGREDDTHTAKFEAALVNFMSTIRHPRNMVESSDEAATLQEALEMQPKDLKHQASSLGSILECIQNIVPKYSSSQLELLDLQNDISHQTREVLLLERDLMKKKSKFLNNLSKQKMELNKNNTRHNGFDRKNEELKTLARYINKRKMIIQALIQLSPDALASDKKLNDILVYTRKPVNLIMYSLQV